MWHRFLGCWNFARIQEAFFKTENEAGNEISGMNLKLLYKDQLWEVVVHANYSLLLVTSEKDSEVCDVLVIAE